MHIIRTVIYKTEGKMATKYIMTKGTLERKDNSINFKNENGNNYIPI